MKRVPLLALVLASAMGSVVRGDEPDALVGRWRIDGVAKDATRESGTVVIERAADGSLPVVLSERSESKDETRRGVATIDGDGFTVAWERTRGVVGALGDGARADAKTTHYRKDGHGGFVGSFERDGKSFVETLAPLADAALVAAIDSALAAGRVLDLARTERAKGPAALRALIEALAERGELYATLGRLDAKDRRELAALAREAAPPDPALDANGAFERAFAQRRKDDRPRWDVIVVPGFTKKDAARVHAIDPQAVARCERAARDFRDGKAPFVLVTGGSVHPEGTPVVEAVELQAELVRLGVPAERIALETHARHSTTNLRDAGRFMLAHGMKKALVVTGTGQSFYFSNPLISTFELRCKEELGYSVGSLRPVDLHRSTFRPSARCLERDETDPFDP